MTCFNINRFHFFVMLYWQLMKVLASQMLFPIFANYVPKWRCAGDVSDVFAKNCTKMTECPNGVEFENNYFESSALEFNWICGQGAYFASFYAQLQFIGVIVGTSLFGSLTDYFGRRPMAIFLIFLALFSFSFAGLAPNWQLLLVSRFFVGFTIGGSIPVTTLCMELILPEQRIPMRCFFNWGTARLAMTLICYFLPNWRHSTLAYIPMILVMILIMIFIIPESPTWLHQKGKLQEMHKVEKKIAKLAHVEYKKSEIEPFNEEQGSILKVLRNPVLFKRMAVISFMFLTSAISSYGNDFNSSSLSGHFYWNQALFSIFICASKFVLIFVDTKFPNFSRRQLHQSSQLAVIVCFVTMVFLTIYAKNSVWILVFNLFGSLFIEFTWDANYLSVAEVMPTNVRAATTGACTLVARFGIMFVPFFSQLNQFWPFCTYTAVIIMGCANLLISYLFLEETKGISLDEVNLEEHHAKLVDEEMIDLKKRRRNSDVMEVLLHKDENANGIEVENNSNSNKA